MTSRLLTVNQIIRGMQIRHPKYLVEIQISFNWTTTKRSLKEYLWSWLRIQLMQACFRLKINKSIDPQVSSRTMQIMCISLIILEGILIFKVE